MESERLRITLDSPERTYFAGQTIKGEIWMNLTKRTKIRAVKIQITGKGKCKWMEILRKNSHNNESTRSLFYSSKEIYTQIESPISVFEPRGVDLSPGEHTFNFTVPLDWHLPSSFKGSHGKIKYKMRVLIQRPWTFDERHTIPLVVVKSLPLPIGARINPTPLEKQITKTINLFTIRPVTIHALLPECFAVRGEPLRICVNVNNTSTTNVEKLRFNVLQYITYYSHVPLRVQKVECRTLAIKETGAIQKKSERSFAHELLMPDTAQPSDDQLSGVINIAYELRVEAVFRGFYKNLILDLPFKVYSHDGAADARSEQHRPPPDVGGDRAGAGNPFESVAGSITANAMPMHVYPALESSVGSPSHSSQYSECSSINSTTSESSATTLSPAVCGGNNSNSAFQRSYTTGDSQSSQYNSLTRRATIRISNGPERLLPSSPMMVQSYPPLTHIQPYPLPESPQYTLMAQAGPVPPPPIPTPLPTPPPIPTPMPTPQIQRLQPSNTEETTAAPSYVDLSGYRLVPSVFLTSRSPVPQELPPSYEELFGNASAPPDSSK